MVINNLTRENIFIGQWAAAFSLNIVLMLLAGTWISLGQTAFIPKSLVLESVEAKEEIYLSWVWGAELVIQHVDRNGTLGHKAQPCKGGGLKLR